MRTIRIIVLGIFAASAATAARAQADTGQSRPQPEIIRLEALVSELLTHNPEIQAARKRFEAAETRPAQQRALPDPQIGAGWASAGAPLPGFGLGTEPTANIGLEISQEIPFPGKRSLRSGMAAKEAESEGQMFRSTELTQVARLKAAFHELRFAYDALDVLRRNQNLLQRLAKVAEARYSVGEGNQQDLVRSEVEISLLDGRILQLEQRKSSLEAEINRLLNRPVSEALGRPEPIDRVPLLSPLANVQQLALARSPMLRSQRAMIDGRQLGVEMARKEYYPDFEVMGGYFNQGAMKDMWEFRIRLNIPIYFWKKQRLGLEEAGLRLTESQRAYRAQEQDLGFRVRDRYLAAEAAKRLMDLYSKTVAPQSTLALESSLASYETGKIEFTSVLSNFSAILDSELNFHEQKAEYLRALAEIDELTGTTGLDD
ncbi:MAG: TolC family protein [Acidobacteriota bacterium]